jgi:hypothetical protein
MNSRTLIVLVLVTGYWVAALCLVELRLHGTVTWSWLWVLSPLWLPLAIIGLVVVGLAATMGMLDAALAHGHRRQLSRE